MAVTRGRAPLARFVLRRTCSPPFFVSVSAHMPRLKPPPKPAPPTYLDMARGTEHDMEHDTAGASARSPARPRHSAMHSAMQHSGRLSTQPSTARGARNPTQRAPQHAAQHGPRGTDEGGVRPHGWGLYGSGRPSTPPSVARGTALRGPAGASARCPARHKAQHGGHVSLVRPFRVEVEHLEPGHQLACTQRRTGT